MRTAGEVLLVIAIFIASGTAVADKVMLDRYLRAGSTASRSPAYVADLTQLPFRGSLVAGPLALAGIALVIAGAAKRHA